MSSFPKVGCRTRKRDSPLTLLPDDIVRDVAFYLSAPAPCPYLPDRHERKLFTQLDAPDAAGSLMSALTQVGFRRSHDLLYRPACDTCQACVPVRIPVGAFRWSRSLRRVMAKNRGLSVRFGPPETSESHYELFLSYQTARHTAGDMARMSRAEFDAMLTGSPVTTRVLELRDAAGVLMGCLIADGVTDGTSAVYSFFAPEPEGASLGTFLILSLIEVTCSAALPYVYLGYWVEASRKMVYKARFHPLERLETTGWRGEGI